MANFYGDAWYRKSEADGTAITDTTTEAASLSVTLPANTLHAGDHLEIWACGTCTATNSTDTCTVAIRLGGAAGTLVVQSAAVDVADNDDFVITGFVHFDSVGSSPEIHGGGFASFTTSGATVAPYAFTDSTDEDTTADLTVDATIDWSVASASNSALFKSLIVRVVPGQE